MVLPCSASRGDEPPAAGGQGPYLQLEGFGALLSDAANYSNLAGGFGWGIRAGWRSMTRWNTAGLFAALEHDNWVSSEVTWDVDPGVLNAAAGIDCLFFGGRVRTSLAAGASRLAFDTVFHDQGTTGFFLDLRPAGLRWAAFDRLIVELSVIGFTLMMPALEDHPIKRIEYRTTLTLEVPL